MPKIIKPATGAFTLASLSIDSSGRVFSAASGTAGGGNMVPTFAEYGPGAGPGTYTASSNANFVGAYLVGGGGGGQGPNNGQGGPGGFGYFTAPISPPFSGPYTIGEAGNSTNGNGTAGTATNLTNIGTANGGGGGGPSSTGSIGNCTAGPDGTLNTAIGLQSNTPGNFDSTSGPFINNGGFSMGLLTVGHANLPSNTLGNNLRGEQNKMFFGQGSTRGNPRGGFFGKGMHGAILIYENTGS
jgi:hypothetical protein|tara:strand:- start:299 stop:1024 length:726 start_codon:yes stop_codon:yes gene_type:complete